MPIEKNHISPPGLFSTQRLGCTHVVTSSPGTTVYISGQTAWDKDRKVVGGKLQAKQLSNRFGTYELLLRPWAHLLVTLFSFGFMLSIINRNTQRFSVRCSKCFSPADLPLRARGWEFNL
jgi:hypothetical protein